MKTKKPSWLSLTVMLLALCASIVPAKAQTPEPTNVEWATYKAPHYTIDYPAFLEITYEDNDIVNASMQDEEYCMLSVNYGEDGPTQAELSELAKNYTWMKENKGCKSEVELKDKLLIIKSLCKDEADADEVGEEAEAVEAKEQIEYYFVVMKEDRVCIFGAFTFDKDKEEKYAPLFSRILSSVKFL